MANDLCSDMLDLLEQEQAALVNGRIDALTRLMPEKERLAAALARTPPTGKAAELARMQQLVARNAGLLSAARRGIGTARARLRQLAEGATLDTYDKHGQRQNLMPGTSRIERRA